MKGTWTTWVQQIEWSRITNNNTPATIVECRTYDNKQLAMSCSSLTFIKKLCRALWSERKTCACTFIKFQSTTCFCGCSIARSYCVWQCRPVLWTTPPRSVDPTFSAMAGQSVLDHLLCGRGLGTFRCVLAIGVAFGIALGFALGQMFGIIVILCVWNLCPLLICNGATCRCLYLRFGLLGNCYSTWSLCNHT